MIALTFDQQRIIIAGYSVLFLFVVTFLMGCVESDSLLDTGQVDEQNTGVHVNMKAPDFTLQTLNGTIFTLREQAQKPVLLNFWATWCGPCVAEMPDMQKLQNRMGDQIKIGSVNLGETRPIVEQFVEQKGYTWTFVTDPQSDLGTLYKVSAIPTSIFIDAQGMIVARKIGMLSFSEMEHLARETLASTP